MNRRKFIKNVAVAGSTAFVLPKFSIGKSGESANSKLNVAFVGVGGIGNMAISGMKSENVVALCDVDATVLRKFKQWHPNAEVFQDYRQMLDKMGNSIDAVCVSTPDHSHFKVTIDSMQCGKHVCVQKPLTHNIWQCRELEKARKYYNLKTQMMNQGHASEHIRLIKEWFDSGVTGPVREVHAMSTGPAWFNGEGTPYFVKPPSLPMPKQEIPEDFDWDLWINNGKYTDYNQIYSSLSWRGFWDYGTGMLGDWFCHTADAPVWALDLKDPISVELVESENTFDSKVFIPDSSTTKWTFPATDKHPELVMYWYDGAKTPITRPKDMDKWRKLPTGGMFIIGDDRTIFTGVRPEYALQVSDSEFFKEFKKNLPEKTIPRARGGSLYLDWIDAIKGDIDQASSNFSYASQLTELALLGCLAQRFGGKIEWDAKNMTSPNRPELDIFIKEAQREGWQTKPLA